MARASDSYPGGPQFDPETRYQTWQGMLKLIQLDFRVMEEVNLTVAHESVLLQDVVGD